MNPKLAKVKELSETTKALFKQFQLDNPEIHLAFVTCLVTKSPPEDIKSENLGMDFWSSCEIEATIIEQEAVLTDIMNAIASSTHDFTNEKLNQGHSITDIRNAVQESIRDLPFIKGLVQVHADSLLEEIKASLRNLV